MGGKLRLSTHRKNEERKKYAVTELPVSINLGPDVMVYLVSIPRRVLELPELIVSLPLQVLVRATPPEITSLHSRLVATRSLPSSWIDLSQLQSHSSVVLCTMHYNEGSRSGEVGFTVRIDTSFQWSVTVSGQLLQPDKCPSLADVPNMLQSVADVGRLLTTIDCSRICEGNADPKFQPLVDRHKGIFRDPSGTACACVCNYSYIYQHACVTV